VQSEVQNWTWGELKLNLAGEAKSQHLNYKLRRFSLASLFITKNTYEKR